MSKRPFNDAFRGLADRLGIDPAAPPAREDRGDGNDRDDGSSGRSDAAGSAAPPGRAPPRAVVRLERKGRGGKEATVIEKLALAAGERERWLKELKRALGCGGAIEGDALVLQGDLRGRVRSLLEDRGVRKVTLG